MHNRKSIQQEIEDWNQHKEDISNNECKKNEKRLTRRLTVEEKHTHQ